MHAAAQEGSRAPDAPTPALLTLYVQDAGALTSSGTSSGVSYTASMGYIFANSIRDPSDSFRDSSNLPRRRLLSKMFSAGTHTPSDISAPASASALAMAQPKPCVHTIHV